MRKRLPTTDLYFLHACSSLIRRWWHPAPVTMLGANCFARGNTLVLIRRDNEALMRQAIDWPGRLIYLIDDDITAAARSPYLPEDYKARLGSFDRDYHSRLIQRADLLLVPSVSLARRFAADTGVTAEIRHIDPIWPFAMADGRHFGDLRNGAPLRIVHLGSGSHGGALAAAAPAIARSLDANPDTEFTYIGRQEPHPALARHPRVRRIEPKSWPRYRRWLPRQRFHLALYPLDETAFDRARSGNKLIEHGIVGAVGVYPEDWGPAHRLGDAAIFAPSDPARWGERLGDILAKREELVHGAAQAADILCRYNSPAAQADMWSAILEIGIDQPRA